MLMQIQFLTQKKIDAKAVKAQKVSELAKLAKGAKVIAIADLRNLPDKHLQSLRKKLRGRAVIAVAKNSLIERALQQAGKATDSMKGITGPTAIIFTDMDPFKLFKLIKESRGKAAAKPGQLAPFDIIVPAGETALPPGPVLTELKQAGLQAQIQAGKVVISKPSTVAKAGEKISDMAAKALQKLGVEPFEVGMELVSAWEAGTIYPRTVLDVDETAFMANLQGAGRNALALSVSIAYPTRASMPLLIGKAARNAKALALGANIYEKDVIDLILARANAQASALMAKAKI